ncbi:LysR family transcriptional regulator [Horticoccus luteus]|uniref:LysR family transcriptional regulator n=1 Tax=Horticoccus luteus TaxID=2862869 RepID=A0A8F9TWV9_9BACT|nr:LysR family transcriptional regulator [Horticoccus luteus]QYM80699.1 LysR family transcriptional regulator [Horticoccus luteus]
MALDQLFKQKVPTPRQLHALVKFVEHGSLSAAFGSGKSAQGAATQQLGRIDRCLGIRTRKSAGVVKVPTDEAIQLAEFCRDFFQRLADFKTGAEGKPNNFVVGAGDSLMFYLLLPALRTTGAWRSSVELHLQNLRSREIVHGVLDGSVDVGLVRATAVEDELTDRKRLKVEPVCQLGYAFYVRTELLKSYRGNIADSLALVKWGKANLPLATFWAEHSTYTEALGRAKLGWPARLRCESFPQVERAIIAADYCGILPRIAFSNIPPEITEFGVDLLAPVSRSIGLVWSSTLTQRRAGGEIALRELRSALKTVCAGPTFSHEGRPETPTRGRRK